MVTPWFYAHKLGRWTKFWSLYTDAKIRLNYYALYAISTDAFVAFYVLAVDPKDAGLRSNSMTQNTE